MAGAVQARPLRHAGMAPVAAATMPRPPVVACGVLMLASLVLLAFNARHGLAVYPDSTRYMGLSPWPYDAPLYHWLLVGGQGLGIGPLAAAMAVAIACCCANTALLFALLMRGTASWPYAAAGTALVMLSPQIVGLHASALSEPPFIALMLGCVWFALDYIERGGTGRLLLAAVLLGLATLTRFTAPPLGAAVALALLLDARRPLARRLADCAVFAVLSGGIFLGWLGWSQLSAGRSLGRELAFNGNLDAAAWFDCLRIISSTILPSQVPVWIRMPLIITVLAFAAWRLPRQVADLRASRSDRPVDAGAALAVILAALLVGYSAFVWLSMMIEANLTLDGRYVVPAYIALVLLVTIQVARLDAWVPAERTQRMALSLLALAMLVSHAGRTVIHTEQAFAQGEGFHSREWRASPTLEAVRGLPADAAIYANGPDVTTLLTGRRASTTPELYDYRSGHPEPGNELPVQIARIRDGAQRMPTYVVILDRLDWRFYLLDEAALVEALSLRLSRRLADGRIYQVPATANPTMQAAPGPLQEMQQ